MSARSGTPRGRPAFSYGLVPPQLSHGGVADPFAPFDKDNLGQDDLSSDEDEEYSAADSDEKLAEHQRMMGEERDPNEVVGRWSNKPGHSRVS
jgi:hypothetical protein